MADTNTTCQDASTRSTTADEDLRDQRAVLGLVLSLHPSSFTLEELVRELTLGSADHAYRDRIERAIRDLVGSGLLHRLGELVLATRAGIKFDELAEL